jgi:multimeric flavodoxin WrbA
MAYNGSPRKNWNTAKLLEKALAGSASMGATTELVHLYDLNYKGCKSCFACKTRNHKSYGRCAVKDDLTPILTQIHQSDGIILGSPFYFGTVSGEMKSFMERLLFPYRTYTDPPQTLFPKRIKTGFIYTMNLTEDEMKMQGYDRHVALNQTIMEAIFGSSEALCCYDTYQFKDYSKMIADRFDADQKAKRRRDVFPNDCKRAFEMGAGLI